MLELKKETMQQLSPEQQAIFNMVEKINPYLAFSVKRVIEDKGNKAFSAIFRRCEILSKTKVLLDINKYEYLL